MPAQIETSSKNIGSFRAIILMWSVVLACQGIWILGAELFRPHQFRFPTDAQIAGVAAENRNAAASAASFGVFRGDLWAAYSLTYLDLLWSQSGETRQNLAVEIARGVAIRALTFAPHDARVWLVLYGLERPDRKWISLQMSYLTGVNEAELIPLRLQLALRSEAIGEKQLQQLVRHDVQTIVTRKPELKSKILAAYQGALPVGQQFLAETLQGLDPALSAKLGKSD